MYFLGTLIVLASVIATIAGLVCAPKVGDSLSGHLEQCPGPRATWAVFAARLRATVINGRRVRLRDGSPAMFAPSTAVWSVAVPVVRGRAHTVHAIA